jgi:hypothetical protein
MKLLPLIALMLLVGCNSLSAADYRAAGKGALAQATANAANANTLDEDERARREAKVQAAMVATQSAMATDAARPTITPTPTMEPTVMPTPTMEPTRTPEPVVVIVVVTPVVTPTTEPTATPILSVRTRSSRTMQDVGLLVVIGIVLIGLGCLGYLFLRPRTRTGPNEE